MTSRERVRQMFRGEGKNEIIVDFGGMSSTGISAIAYAKLLGHIGMADKPVKVYDIFQQVAEIDPEVVDYMGGDFVQAYRMRLRFDISCKQWKASFLADGTPCLVPSEFSPVEDARGNRNIEANGKVIARMPKGGFYFDQVWFPLEGTTEVQELDAFTPYRMRQDDITYIADEVRKLYTTTDKAIVLGFGGSIFEQGQRDFGFEDLYCNLAAEKELMHVYFQKTTDAYLYNLEQLLTAAGEQIDVVQFFDDLGTQGALQISPQMYREMIKPYQKQLYAYIHQNFPHIKVLLHSCGAIFDIIPDLIEIGVNLLNPVQISAVGMDPERLKSTYGGQIIFWGGGADLQNFVAGATVPQIKEHVAGLLNVFAKDGNYIFSQIHNFQHDIPPEKITAIFDTAKQHKKQNR